MEYVMRYNIEILPINTKDIFAKPLPKEMFEILRDIVQWIDWTNNYYPHFQTRECGFYKAEGVVTTPRNYQLSSIWDWNIDAAGKRF